MSALREEQETLGRAYDHRLMLRLLACLGPSRRLFALSALLLLLFSLAQLVGPLLTRRAIDVDIAGGDMPGLWRTALLWLGLIVAGAGVQYVQIVAMNLMGQRAMADLRNRIYGHLQRLPMSFYDRNPTGRLLTRATNDVEVLSQLLSQGVVAILGDLFTLAGIAAILLALEWRLALAAFAVLPLLILSTVWFQRMIRGAYRDVRSAVARINTYLQEALAGMPVIKALRRERRNQAEFDDLARLHQEAFLRSVRAFSVYLPLVDLLAALAVALLLWRGAGGVASGALTLGSLVAFIQYTGRFFHPIRDLAEKFNVLQDAMASAERIFKLLDEPAEAEPAACPTFDPRGEIRFEAVRFSYDGRSPILQGLDARFAAGRTTAIVGPTGSGKSTVIGLLSRFYTPLEGRITVAGVELQTIPRGAWRRHLAVVQQDVFLFSGSVEENLRLGRSDIPRTRLEEALASSHADRLVARLPGGLAGRVAEGGAGFSAGERQLLAIARALAFDPAVLILDEATASVDSETEGLIQDALQRLLQGRTSVVIAHRLSTVQSAESILVLQRGRVVEQGTHAFLLAAGGLYATLHRLQFQDDRTAAP